MKIAVDLHTIDYRGDHAADTMIAHELKPGETVEQLVTRLLGKNTYVGAGSEYVMLRIVQEPVDDDTKF